MLFTTVLPFLTLLPVMKTLHIYLLPFLLLTAQLTAAINPQVFIERASELLDLREISRVTHLQTLPNGDSVRRVTLIASVENVCRGPASLAGETIVIDWSVNLTERQRRLREHLASSGNMPGPQFMGEPNPLPSRENNRFQAALAPAGSRLGNVNRYAGALPGIGDYEFLGLIFVPVAGDYSFSPLPAAP